MAAGKGKGGRGGGPKGAVKGKAEGTKAGGKGKVKAEKKMKVEKKAGAGEGGKKGGTGKRSRTDSREIPIYARRSLRVKNLPPSPDIVDGPPTLTPQPSTSRDLFTPVPPQPTSPGSFLEPQPSTSRVLFSPLPSSSSRESPQPSTSRAAAGEPQPSTSAQARRRLNDSEEDEEPTMSHEIYIFQEPTRTGVDPEKDQQSESRPTELAKPKGQVAKRKTSEGTATVALPPAKRPKPKPAPYCRHHETTENWMYEGETVPELAEEAEAFRARNVIWHYLQVTSGQMVYVGHEIGDDLVTFTVASWEVEHDEDAILEHDVDKFARIEVIPDKEERSYVRFLIDNEDLAKSTRVDVKMLRNAYEAWLGGGLLRCKNRDGSKDVYDDNDRQETRRVLEERRKMAIKLLAEFEKKQGEEGAVGVSPSQQGQKSLAAFLTEKRQGGLEALSNGQSQGGLEVPVVPPSGQDQEGAIVESPSSGQGEGGLEPSPSGQGEEGAVVVSPSGQGQDGLESAPSGQSQGGLELEASPSGQGEEGAVVGSPSGQGEEGAVVGSPSGQGEEGAVVGSPSGQGQGALEASSSPQGLEGTL